MVYGQVSEGIIRFSSVYFALDMLVFPSYLFVVIFPAYSVQ
jgi:hypothetical protein